MHNDPNILLAVIIAQYSTFKEDHGHTIITNTIALTARAVFSPSFNK